MISFSVPGKPVPKGRPRVALRGKFPTLYTPKKTREAEQWFRDHSNQFKPDQPFEGPVALQITFYTLRPKGLKKSQTEWTKKPDIDNLAKQAIDSMNGTFYKDDAQIVTLICGKLYGPEAKTEIHICEKEIY